jgi:hypothetical protein
LFFWCRIKSQIDFNLLASVGAEIKIKNLTTKQWKNEKELDGLNSWLKRVDNESNVYFSHLKSGKRQTRLSHKLFSGEEIKLKNILTILSTYHTALLFGNRSVNSPSSYPTNLPSGSVDYTPLLIPRFIGDSIIIEVVESICSSLFNLFLNIKDVSLSVASGIYLLLLLLFYCFL